MKEAADSRSPWRVRSAMPISVACPTCGAKLKAPDNAAGKKLKSHKCKSRNRVTEVGDVAASAVSAAPPAKARPKPPEDELDQLDELPEGDEPDDEDHPDDRDEPDDRDDDRP